MKTAIFILFLLLVTESAFAEKVRVYTDYTPVRILKLISSEDFDLEANKAGLKGNYKEIEESLLPSDRSDRDAWKINKGTVEVDVALKSDRDKADTDKTTALDKLKNATGLTDEEIKLLGLGDR
jgi:hypothetical protein